MSATRSPQRMIPASEGFQVKHPNGADMLIKVFAADTDGAYSLMETTLPPGAIVPRHVHEDEDENNLILEGELTMHIGNTTYVAGPGAYVIAPRGVEQHFVNAGSGNCRFLTTFTPGGAEGFFKEAGELIKAAAPAKPDAGAIARLQEKYKLRYF
ncbi:cupin domain-containing protein [Burkholderia sp. IMCC1007]|uniref:cupin domain-containing protein n=1 Tax=Burkholderia sp. IMCC1007 TaxID=3004104 RepID=UPI0022B4ED44|nr:cupin domain-containing protein [Burkholderia sp. IMCC1007]